MLFYKLNATLAQDEILPQQQDQNACEALINELDQKSKAYFHESCGEVYLFGVCRRPRGFVFGMLAKDAIDVEYHFSQYTKTISPAFIHMTYEEVTYKHMSRLMRTASRKGTIDDSEEIFALFDLIESDFRYHSFDYGENLITGNTDKNALIRRANDLLLGTTLVPEIKRIYRVPLKKQAKGHPVHYIIRCDNKVVRREIWSILMEALYANHRIQSRRYFFVNFDRDSTVLESVYDMLYRLCENSVMIVHCNDSNDQYSIYAHWDEDAISTICEMAYKYKNKVLTIFCFPLENHLVKDYFLSHLDSMSFIELYEDVAFDKQVRTYLATKAKEVAIHPDKSLFSSVEPHTGYTPAQLNHIFNLWYDLKLKNTVYPQYKMAETAKAAIQKADVKGTSYEKLQQMIGLDEVKRVMDQILNYAKMQKIFTERFQKTSYPAMHMVFTGNPGTAKTTVARLLAGVLKENGILQKGDLYEVGRADLVGKYVGSTAPLVKAMFRKARGGVLFIDEAYSLVDDHDGMYGDEAINTIVQEMENNRDNMIVIFAGYPDKMKTFLNKNPGLRSRIAFHVSFRDYDTDQLCRIADLIAVQEGLQLSDDARTNIRTACAIAKTQEHFGNGRYVRTLIEKAKMHQACRLMQINYASICDEDIVTLQGEDIEIPPQKQSKQRRIGFY